MALQHTVPNAFKDNIFRKDITTLEFLNELEAKFSKNVGVEIGTFILKWSLMKYKGKVRNHILHMFNMH